MSNSKNGSAYDALNKAQSTVKSAADSIERGLKSVMGHSKPNNEEVKVTKNEDGSTTVHIPPSKY